MSALLTSPTSTVAQQPPRPAESRVRRRLPVRFDALIVGIVASAFAFAFAWVPSVWFDEAATVVASTRSWADLARMLGTVDVVHATYYAFMHLWFDVFPYSPLSLRMPSVLATGVTAGLTVVIGRLLVGRRVGIVAGLLLAILPRVTWMGGEGRSYAITTMLGAGSTLLLLIAWRATAAGRRSAPWWIGYTAVSLLSCAMFLYSALLVLSHGIAMVLLILFSRTTGVQRSRGLRAGIRWLLAALIVAVACMPLAMESSRQSAQIDWIKRPGSQTVGSVVSAQWFFDNIPFTVFAWMLVAASLVLVFWRRSRAGRNTIVLALPMVVVPTAALIVMSFVTHPLYTPRYLTFTSPAIALLMAVGLAAIRWKSVIAAGLIVGVGLSATTYVQQRELTSKDLAAWNQVAGIVAAQRAAEPADTVGAVVYGPVRRHPAATSRIIEETYPSAFTGLRDITLKTPAADTDGLWEKQWPLEQVLDRTKGADEVWLITSDKRDWRPRVTGDLESQGFHIERTWHVSRTNIVLYER